MSSTPNAPTVADLLAKYPTRSYSLDRLGWHIDDPGGRVTINPPLIIRGRRVDTFEQAYAVEFEAPISAADLSEVL